MLCSTQPSWLEGMLFHETISLMTFVTVSGTTSDHQWPCANHVTSLSLSFLKDSVIFKDAHISGFYVIIFGLLSVQWLYYILLYRKKQGIKFSHIFLFNDLWENVLFTNLVIEQRWGFYFYMLSLVEKHIFILAFPHYWVLFWLLELP